MDKPSTKIVQFVGAVSINNLNHDNTCQVKDPLKQFLLHN